MVSDKIHEISYSFPDSHGDDLIVEILDSNGKEFGRVLVQLAYFSEDSVVFFSYFFVFLICFKSF